MTAALEHGAWLPDVREKISRMIDAYGGGRGPGEEKGPLAVFDLDQTCIKGDVGYSFFHHMVENVLLKYRFGPFRKFFMEYDLHGYAGLALEKLDASRGRAADRSELAFLIYDIYGAIRDEMGDGESFNWMAGLLLGWRHEEVREATRRLLLKEFVTPMGEKVLAKSGERKWVVPVGIRVFSEIKNLIGVLAGSGFDVWIISATSQPIVEAAGQFLGVGPERCIGVRHKTEGEVYAALGDNVTYRNGKVEAIRNLIGKKPVFAVGDWYTDLEMLDYCDGISLLLDRGRKDLVELGKKKGWLLQPVFPVR